MSPSKKRQREDDDDDPIHDHGNNGSPTSTASRPTSSRIARTNTSSKADAQQVSSSAGGPGGTSSNFRNVSACNRCRHRKNRCDQKLPQCSACVKASAQCVGFDPVSKREIPRSYVYFLETRLISLERLLQKHNIPVPSPEESFPISPEVRPGVNVPFPPLKEDPAGEHAEGKTGKNAGKDATDAEAIDPELSRPHDVKPRVKLAANRPRSAVFPPDLRKTLPQKTMQPPGISFSKVVFAAVRSSVSQTASEKGGERLARDATRKNSIQATQDCFFGLVTRTTFGAAAWPDYDLALKLTNLYFEHANPQIPILHRGEFMTLFERVYTKPQAEKTPREAYLLLMVFAIGSGIIVDGSSAGRDATSASSKMANPEQKKGRLASAQCQPEEYHAAAMIHLEHFLSTPAAMEGHGGGMEELQAVLLSAALALLRPIAPGLWYIVGVAVRLAVDLGLHFEDADPELDDHDATMPDPSRSAATAIRIGKKQWKRDLRRRLWWCVYSYDRLVSTCVGRPFGITDQVVTTEFPTLLDDTLITKDGFNGPASGVDSGPTYKLVSHHYFRLRLLQSEILQVLQYRQAQQARLLGANAGNVYMHTRLPSPFLQRFSSFREWRADVDRRLGEWKDGAPTESQIGVAFTPLFLELNYWQAIIMLYRQSLAVPAPLAEEFSASTGEHMSSPGNVNHELQQDEQLVFLKVTQAGQMVIKTYRQLHRLKLVNYTFLATHHLFMSGISFLYALWHSPYVRSQLTLDDVDFTVLAGTSILDDLIANCPPAEACRNAFQRMSRATIGMCLNTTGFGGLSALGSQPVETPGGSWTTSGVSLAMQSPGDKATEYFSPQSVSAQSVLSTNNNVPSHASTNSRRALPLPEFDMNLSSLLYDDEQTNPRALASRSQRHVRTLSNLTQDLLRAEAATTTSPNAGLGSYRVSNKAQYAPLASSINAVQPDLSFDNLDFLDSFVIDDPNRSSWLDGFELDLGFGTGGTGGQETETDSQWQFEGETDGAHNASGVDLFDGFFFGT